MTISQPITISDVMRAYALEAEQMAHRELGVTLNYAEDSLQHVNLLLSARLVNGPIIAPRLDKSEEEAMWQFCKVIGGYFGEVVIRNIGGTWLTDVAADGSRTTLLNVADIIQARPPDSIWRCLTEPGRGSIVGLYETLLATLAVTRGESTIENGLKTVKLPQLSQNPPNPPIATPVVATLPKPWWKFW